EGRNLDFNRKIQVALVPKQNTLTASIVFDNYAIFAINTIHGYVNAIYDNLRKIWVCFDKLGIDPIKMFAVANQSTDPVLYGITENKVYQFLSSTTDAAADVSFKVLSPGTASSEVVLSDARGVFIGGTLLSQVVATQ